MGRPIKKEFIGGNNVLAGQEMLVIDSAFIPGNSSVSSNVKIISQKGTGRYIVTDGTNTGLVSLVDGSNDYVPVLGEAVSKVAVFDENPKTEITYTPASITVNGAGSGYAVNDTITLPNIGTVTVKTVSTAVTGGEIQTGVATLSNTSQTTDMAGNSVSGTGGKGTGATFTVTSTESNTYLPNEVTLNAKGTGYAVNDTITLTNVGVLTVTAIGTDGAISTYTSALNGTSKTTDMAGTGISQQSTTGSGTGATFNVTTTSTKNYTPSNVVLNAKGSGYAVNDVLTIANVGTYKVNAVSTAVTGGEILTISSELLTTTSTTDMAGNAVTGTGGKGTGATFTVTSTEATKNIPNIEYASKIFNRTVVTFEDNVYAWNINIKANQDGEADLTTIKKS